jgi:hypothetical protein
LPKNLKKGFGTILKFDSLEADSLESQAEAAKALAKCGITPPCGSNPSVNPQATQVVDTNPEKQKILDLFANSLSTVEKVCKDPYFGTPEMQSTGDDLDKMLNDVNAIDTNAPCAVNAPLFCSLYDTSGEVVNGVSAVNEQINKFTDSDEVKDWEENASYLQILHALPYMLVISALFFLAFWWRDGQCWCCCCCKDGSKLGCLYIFPHAFFWFVFFLINTIIFCIGLAIQMAADEVTLDILNGKPTLADFMEHLQTAWPEFWELVFDGLETNLLAMWQATFVFELFSIVIVGYGCCMCCWRPYRRAYSQKVIDASATTQEQKPMY